jgi:hypothetical protein
VTTGTLRLMRKRTETFEASALLEVCVKKVGVRQGSRVVGFVLRWQAFRNEVGHDITVTEFIERSGLPRRTAFRQLREFRQVFDRQPDATPNDVLYLIEAAQSAEKPAPLRPARA